MLPIIPELPPPPPPQEIQIYMEYPWADGLITQEQDEQCAIDAVFDNPDDWIMEDRQYRYCVILHSED